MNFRSCQFQRIVFDQTLSRHAAAETRVSPKTGIAKNKKADHSFCDRPFYFLALRHSSHLHRAHLARHFHFKHHGQIVFDGLLVRNQKHLAKIAG